MCTLKVDISEHSNHAEDLVARLSLHKPPVASAEASHLQHKGAPNPTRLPALDPGWGLGGKRPISQIMRVLGMLLLGIYVMESGKKLVFALPVCSAKNRDTLRISVGLVHVLWFGPAFQNVPVPSGRARGAHRDRESGSSTLSVLPKPELRFSHCALLIL